MCLRKIQRSYCVFCVFVHDGEQFRRSRRHATQNVNGDRQQSHELVHLVDILLKSVESKRCAIVEEICAAARNRASATASSKQKRIPFLLE